MKTDSDILRFVDTIHRDKEIDKEMIFQAIEAAYLTSVKKKLGESESINVIIDRESGDIQIFDGEAELEVEDLGRIAASTGKQVLFQKIREAERDVIYEEYIHKVGTLVSGVVQRIEGANMIISLGKVEGFLPRSEQAPGERFRVGERIKVIVEDIRKNANRVRIILSRTSPDFVKRLFELEVPEIADKTIEIKGIAREPGYRTKIAVTTYDTNVDCVGACVGVRGSRIKNIVDELFGEKIDIVRWNDSIEVLIMNALKPAEISSMDLDFDQRRTKVYVMPDQQSIAIGKRGQNVRLASKMSEWEIDIVTVSEEELEKLRTEEFDEEGRPIDIGVMGQEEAAAAAVAAAAAEGAETTTETTESAESADSDSSEPESEEGEESAAETESDADSQDDVDSEEDAPDSEDVDDDEVVAEDSADVIEPTNSQEGPDTTDVEEDGEDDREEDLEDDPDVSAASAVPVVEDSSLESDVVEKQEQKPD